MKCHAWYHVLFYSPVDSIDFTTGYGPYWGRWTVKAGSGERQGLYCRTEGYHLDSGKRPSLGTAVYIHALY